MIEILITLSIVFSASFVLYKNIKSKSSGGCNCGSCSSHCPVYDEKKK